MEVIPVSDEQREAFKSVTAGGWKVSSMQPMRRVKRDEMVPFEAMDDDRLRNLTNWKPRKPVSRACLLAAARNRYRGGAIREIEYYDDPWPADDGYHHVCYVANCSYPATSRGGDLGVYCDYHFNCRQAGF